MSVFGEESYKLCLGKDCWGSRFRSQELGASHGFFPPDLGIEFALFTCFSTCLFDLIFLSLAFMFVFYFGSFFRLEFSLKCN